MVSEPLQRRIGIDHVVGVIRRPLDDVGLDEPGIDAALARIGQHFGRKIDRVDLRVRPARPQKRGRISRAAAKIRHASRLFDRHACEQIRGGARAFGAKGEIGLRIPAHSS